MEVDVDRAEAGAIGELGQRAGGRSHVEYRSRAAALPVGEAHIRHPYLCRSRAVACVECFLGALREGGRIEAHAFGQFEMEILDICRRTFKSPAGKFFAGRAPVDRVIGE